MAKMAKKVERTPQSELPKDLKVTQRTVSGMDFYILTAPDGKDYLFTTSKAAELAAWAWKTIRSKPLKPRQPLKPGKDEP